MSPGAQVSIAAVNEDATTPAGRLLWGPSTVLAAELAGGTVAELVGQVGWTEQTTLMLEGAGTTVPEGTGLEGTELGPVLDGVRALAGSAGLVTIVVVVAATVVTQTVVVVEELVASFWDAAGDAG